MQNTDSPNPTRKLATSSYLSEEYLRNVAWQFRQALHLNDQETIENLLNSTSLTTTKKNLLKAMFLAWQANRKAKTFLEDLLKGTDLIDKVWVCFTLSEFYLTQGNIKDSKHYCDVALRQVINKEATLPSYLCSLLAIWNIDIKLDVDKPDKFNYEEFANELKKINTSSNIRLIRGYSYLVLGRLERLNPTINSNTGSDSDSDSSHSNKNSLTHSLAYFEKAIKELQEIDRYYLSLVQVEIATSAKLELSERKNLILLAQANLKPLKKTPQLAKIEYLLSELTSQTVTISKHSYSHESIGNCLFISPAMKEIKQKLEIVARYSNNDPILILGEKGTGKERIASAIQELSAKIEKTGKTEKIEKIEMQSFNCSNLSKELFESVMFGHRKGAFTGANEDKVGLFESVGNGILFLDEIGDIPIDCQAKFLRVLQDKGFARMGEETKMRRFNGRIVAATNKDLREMVEKDLFRGDLFDRLNVWVVNLPSLDKRKEEIIPLAEFFLQLHGQGQDFILSQSARNYLLTKQHLANIRGLEIDIKRSIVKALSQSTRIITEQLLIDKPLTDKLSTETTSIDKKELIEQIEPFEQAINKYEKKIILEALNVCDGNRKLTISHLRLLERRFYLLLKKHNINQY